MAKLELRLAVLFRGAQPQTRAAMAERALVRTIAEWAHGAGVSLDLQTSRDGAAVRVRMRPLGDAVTADLPPVITDADVSRALDDDGQGRSARTPHERPDDASTGALFLDDWLGRRQNAVGQST